MFKYHNNLFEYSPMILIRKTVKNYKNKLKENTLERFSPLETLKGAIFLDNKF